MTIDGKKLLDKLTNLGWESSISLDEGLRSTIDNFIYNYEKSNVRT